MDTTVTSASRHRRARERLLRHTTACWSTQALGVAVEMDLPDRLAAGPASAATLATDCWAPAPEMAAVFHQAMQAMTTMVTDDIVACCAQAAACGSRLLLVERVRPQRLRPRQHDTALARTDMNMLTGLGG